MLALDYSRNKKQINMTDFYRPCTITLNKKQSSHIDKRVYEDKQVTDDKRKYPNGQRSEYVRKLIEGDMKDETNI